MANGIPSANDYRRARIAAAALLFSVVALIVLLDALRTDFDVNPLVLVPLLVVAGGLLGVELPTLKRNGG